MGSFGRTPGMFEKLSVEDVLSPSVETYIEALREAPDTIPAPPPSFEELAEDDDFPF